MVIRCSTGPNLRFASLHLIPGIRLLLLTMYYFNKFQAFASLIYFQAFASPTTYYLLNSLNEFQPEAQSMAIKNLS